MKSSPINWWYVYKLDLPVIDIFQAFSIFTGLGIHNCQMYENACKLMAKQSVALEVLSYHATAQNDETEKLMV